MSRRDIQKRSLPVDGSIFDWANKTGRKVEEIIADAEAIVMVDRSGSMDARVGYEGKRRIDLAQEALEQVQRQFRGKVVVFAFDTTHQICYEGRVPSPRGGTAVARMLQHVQEFDGTDMKFILISDGQPQDGRQAIDIARRMIDPVDTIFIGEDGSHGEEFMRELAEVGKGKNLQRTDLKQLGANIAGLLVERSKDGS